MYNRSGWAGYFDQQQHYRVAFVTPTGLFTPHFGGNHDDKTSSTGVKRCLMRVRRE